MAKIHFSVDGKVAACGRTMQPYRLINGKMYGTIHMDRRHVFIGPEYAMGKRRCKSCLKALMKEERHES